MREIPNELVIASVQVTVRVCPLFVTVVTSVEVTELAAGIPLGIIKVVVSLPEPRVFIVVEPPPTTILGVV